MIIGWKPSLWGYFLLVIWFLQQAMKDCPKHGCHFVLSFIHFLNTLIFAKTHNLATKNPKLQKPSTYNCCN
jgi:hypothetical protein